MSSSFSYLSSSLVVQVKEVANVLFAESARFIDFVAENEHWAVGQLLVAEKTLNR